MKLQSQSKKNCSDNSRNRSIAAYFFLYVKYIVYSVGARIKWAFSKKTVYIFWKLSAPFFYFKNIIFEMRRHSQKYEEIISCIFTQPIINSSYLAEKINVSLSQARKYLVALEKAHILSGDDRVRGRKYYFLELLELLRRN